MNEDLIICREDADRKVYAMIRELPNDEVLKLIIQLGGGEYKIEPGCPMCLGHPGFYYWAHWDGGYYAYCDCPEGKKAKAEKRNPPPLSPEEISEAKHG